MTDAPDLRHRTARAILEPRLGRDLGPIPAMPADLRKAMYRLGLHLNKHRSILR